LDIAPAKVRDREEVTELTHRERQLGKDEIITEIVEPETGVQAAHNQLQVAAADECTPIFG
jgi:hypothetical protein